MATYKKRVSRKSDEIWLLSYADLITNLLIFFVAMFAMMDMSRARMERLQESLTGTVDATSLRNIEEELQKQIAEKGYKDVVKVELTDRGVEISLNSGIVFDVGSEKIDPKWLPILDDVIQQVAKYSNRYEFAVEGHTDDTPIKNGGRFLSNWELASARAHQVRQRLEENGVPGRRSRVESYGDTRHLPGEQLQNLSETDIRSRHRRVVIRIF